MPIEKTHSPRFGVSVKFWYPPPRESLSKMGTPPGGIFTFLGSCQGVTREPTSPDLPPPGCRKLFRAAGVNHTKGSSRAVGELRERDILLYSVSFFVCKKWILPLGVSVKFWYPPRKSRQKWVPPLAKGSPSPYEKFEQALT